MIGRRGLRTSFRRLFSSLVRSVGRSVSRAFVCSFVPSHFIYFILFLPNYNVQFLVPTHGEAEEVTLFCFVFLS